MSTKKILFPTDFSHVSEVCLDQAATLAHDTGATLLVLHVEEPPIGYAGGEMYYSLPQDEHSQREEMLQAQRPHDASVPVEHRLVQGDPGRQIVQIAEDEHVELIVLPSHGRSGLRRLLMGSVAEFVVRHANCPVLTIKEPYALSHATAT